MRTKSSPSEDDGGEGPVVSEFSPVPSSTSVHYHEAEHERRPPLALSLDKLDEPTMHSVYRNAINQWILTDEGWHAEFPGRHPKGIEPILKAIAIHRHGIKMLMGVLYKEEANEAYEQWREENDSKDTFEEMETDAVIKYGQLVDAHELGFRKPYRGKRDEIAEMVHESGQELDLSALEEGEQDGEQSEIENDDR